MYEDVITELTRLQQYFQSIFDGADDPGAAGSRFVMDDDMSIRSTGRDPAMIPRQTFLLISLFLCLSPSLHMSSRRYRVAMEDVSLASVSPPNLQDHVNALLNVIDRKRDFDKKLRSVPELCHPYFGDAEILIREARSFFNIPAMLLALEMDDYPVTSS